VGLGELALRMAVLALVLQVLAFERERLDLALGVVGERQFVSELLGAPRSGVVAMIAVVAERALMQRVLVALRVAAAVGVDLRERHRVLAIAAGVAVGARHAVVAFDERELRLE